jgi:leader peptidase (prepilin peptidase) / N-methyltransferase
VNLLLIGIALGVAFGAMATKLVDHLPRRYNVAPSSREASSRRSVSPLIIFITVLATVGIALVLTGVPNDSFEHLLFLLVTNAALSAFVIAAAAIDLEHMILPNELTLGGALIALLSSPLRSIGPKAAIIGAIVGIAITYAPFVLFKKVRKQSGMGLGDAKLSLLAGAWLGWEGAIAVLFLGALQSVIAAVVMRALGLRYTVPASVKKEIDDLRARASKGDEEAKRDLEDDPMAMAKDDDAPSSAALLSARLPLGPFLALACIETLFLRRQIVEHVFGWLMR